jgi:hypothetical protein
LSGKGVTYSAISMEEGMLEIIAYGVLGGMIVFASLVLWWFVQQAE